MARKVKPEHEWDDSIIEPIRNIPDNIQDIVVAAHDLVKTSIKDAKEFHINHANPVRFHRSNPTSMEAVDWLFYSSDNRPWSFGWVMDLIATIRGEDVNVAAARLTLLRDPFLRAAKQGYDLMMSQGFMQKNGTCC